MRVYGKKIDGEIWSDGLSNSIHPVILLGGELRGGELQTYAFDYIEGKETVYATCKIKKMSDRLVLETLEQPVEFFPKQAELFADPDALKDKPLTNFDLINQKFEGQQKVTEAGKRL